MDRFSRVDQPNWRPALNRFFNYVRTNCQLEVIDPEDLSVDRRPFMPIDEVKHYLERNYQTELRAILGELFEPGHSVHPGDILSGYTAVFCTLLFAGNGRYIRTFIRYDSLNDRRLPFSPDNAPANLPTTPGDPDFLRKFCNEQWRFCVPTLENVTDRCFEIKRILPIIYKKSIAGGSGASANLWLIKIYPSYNKLITEEEKLRLGPEFANTFVIKEYSTSDARIYYETEASAFRRIGPHPNIIRFYGSFTRGEENFNVLLEHADVGTLRTFFAESTPPTNEESVKEFWKKIFQLMAALLRIHEIEPENPEDPQMFQGFHQDVKPDNILIVSNGSRDFKDWEFKLADLGLSHFEAKTRPGDNISADDKYGTKTYGAPECSRFDRTLAQSRLKIKQNIDIWSLGCIYSEIIRWLAHKSPGLDAYREERKKEIADSYAVGAKDCFHNGDTVLEAVRRSNCQALGDFAHGSFINPEIVAMIHDMLSISEERPTALTLWRKHSRIIMDAERTLVDRKNRASSTDTSDSQNQGMSRSLTQSMPRPSSGFSLNGYPPDYHSQVPVVLEIPAVTPDTPQRATGRASHWEERGLEEQRGSSQPTIGSIQAQFETINMIQTSPRLSQHESSQSSTTTTSLPSPQSPPGANSPSLYSGFYPDPLLPTPPSASRQFTNTSWANDAKEAQYRYHNEAAMHESKLQHGVTQGSPPPITQHNASYENRTDHFNRIGSQHGHSTSARRTTNTSANPLYVGVGQSPVASGVAHISAHPIVTTPSPHDDSRPQAWPPPDTTTRYQTDYITPASIQLNGTSQNSVDQLPYMTISQALDWKWNCKSSKSVDPSLDKNLQKRLAGRDHVFLIDDAISMAPYWDEVVKLLEALSYILKRIDKDGLDLYFTNSDDSLKSIKKTTRMSATVRGHKPTAQKSTTTDINIRLKSILYGYTEKLESRNPLRMTPKPLSLFIITNGVWESNCTAIEPIENAVKTLEALRKHKSQIGIQFISVGTDSIGLNRLRHLDDGLGLNKDIVDTEPSDGNVWKMLLGSVNETMDASDGNRNRYSTVSTIPNKQQWI